MPGLPSGGGGASKFSSARTVLERQRLGAFVGEVDSLAVSARALWALLAAAAPHAHAPTTPPLATTTTPAFRARWRGPPSPLSWCSSRPSRAWATRSRCVRAG